MRTIKFKLLTQNLPVTLETNATTYAELEKDIMSTDLADKINLGNVKLIERLTKAEYGSVPDAVLPEGDIMFFVTPKKTKSGVEYINYLYLVPEMQILVVPFPVFSESPIKEEENLEQLQKEAEHIADTAQQD